MFSLLTPASSDYVSVFGSPIVIIIGRAGCGWNGIGMAGVVLRNFQMTTAMAAKIRIETDEVVNHPPNIEGHDQLNSDGPELKDRRSTSAEIFSH